MRGRFGIGALVVAFFLGAVFWQPLVTLYNLNIETVAQEKGADKILSKGLEGLMESGLFPLVAFAFPFAIGVGATLLAESQYLRRKRDESFRTSARFQIEFKGAWYEGKRIKASRMKNIGRWYYMSHSELKLLLLFEKPMAEACIDVFTNKEGLKWKELLLTEELVLLEIEGDFAPSKMFVKIAPKAMFYENGKRQQLPNIPNDAISLEDERFEMVAETFTNPPPRPHFLRRWLTRLAIKIRR